MGHKKGNPPESIVLMQRWQRGQWPGHQIVLQVTSVSDTEVGHLQYYRHFPRQSHWSYMFHSGVPWMCLFICNCTKSSTYLYDTSRSSLETKLPPALSCGKSDFANHLRDLTWGPWGIYFFTFPSYALIFLAYTGYLFCWGRVSLWNCSCAEKFSSDGWLTTWVLLGTSGSPHLPASFCSVFRSHHTK